jgi:catalase
MSLPKNHKKYEYFLVKCDKTMKRKKEKRHLTTNQGVPITDNQNSLTVGERGSASSSYQALSY